MLIKMKVLGNMKIRSYWDIAPCSLGLDQRFRGSYSIHHQGGDISRCRMITLMMETVRRSETSVYSNETARLYIPYLYLHIHRRENQKSHILGNIFMKCFSTFCMLISYGEINKSFLCDLITSLIGL
jgi:hypothetical protein